MKFYSICVSPKTTTKVQVPEDCTLRLTQCSLGENVQNGRSILKVTADGKDCVIASLISDKMEHCVMELMFEEGTYVFSVSGKNEIHVAGNMMDSDDGDMGHDHDDEDEDEDEDEDDQPQRVNMGKGRAQPPSDDDDDDDDDEDEEMDDAEGSEEDSDEGEEEEESEDEAPPPANKKRAAPPAAKEPPAKAAKQGKAPVTPSGKGGATPASTPGKSPNKEVPADMKSKIKQVLAVHAGGIKGADFPREWEKMHKTQFKKVFTEAGFKKMTEFMKAAPEVARVDEQGGGNITFFPVSKKK